MEQIKAIDLVMMSDEELYEVEFQLTNGDWEAPCSMSRKDVNSSWWINGLEYKDNDLINIRRK